MPACGAIVVSPADIAEYGCKTAKKKCRWLVARGSLSVSEDKVVAIWACISEEQTCGGCCKEMLDR